MEQEKFNLKDKYLIASGCSIVKGWEGYKTWAYWLEEKTQPKKHYNEADGGSGNALIMRRTMYRVEQLLQSGVSPDDIVLLISWSDAQRDELYLDEYLANKYTFYPNNIQKFTTYIDNSDQNLKWLHGMWDLRGESAYHTFRKLELCHIKTLEYILMLQMFLEKRNIKYVMMSYMDIFSDGYVDYEKSIPYWEDFLLKDVC